jgi:hypothetical protein
VGELGTVDNLKNVRKLTKVYMQFTTSSAFFTKKMAQCLKIYEKKRSEEEKVKRKKGLDPLLVGQRWWILGDERGGFRRVKSEGGRN